MKHESGIRPILKRSEKKEEDNIGNFFFSFPERSIDSKAEFITSCLEININEKQMGLKIKMLS